MAAGGFKFGQSSATYDSAEYTTKRAWALEVHKTRCDAFFKAQYREGDTWTCVQTYETGEITESRTVDGHTYTIYIQDWHPTSSDSTGAYPSFTTFWKKTGTNTEYSIITSNGMHWEPSYSSNINYGMYIHADHLPNTSNSFGYKYTFVSLAHSFAYGGFVDYCFSISDVNDRQLPIFPISGFYGDQYASSTSTANNSYSIVYNPTQGVTYSFGYAIRGTVIECFYRTSQYNANSGWNWSIIGTIISNSISGYPDAYYSYYNAGNEKAVIDSSYYPRYSRSQCPFACIRYDETVFPPVLISNNVIRYPRLTPSFMPNRCNSTMPSDLLFSAGCLAFCANSGSQYTETYDGIDGEGNCVVGIIDTDILRIVARQACNVGGATYQGGNFVVPTRQVSIDNADDFSVILGWDPSNESIV